MPGTAFEIVSIDIADVDVGKNIGAELQTSQAEADRRIAQAKAAERQYAALAAEQEMKAETQRMRAKVVEAEATIPQAIAEAFRSGNLGVMDYYRLKNIKADTEMRGAIGREHDRAPAPTSEVWHPALPSTRTSAIAVLAAWTRDDRIGRRILARPRDRAKRQPRALARRGAAGA